VGGGVCQRAEGNAERFLLGWGVQTGKERRAMNEVGRTRRKTTTRCHPTRSGGGNPEGEGGETCPKNFSFRRQEVLRGGKNGF